MPKKAKRAAKRAALRAPPTKAKSAPLAKARSLWMAAAAFAVGVVAIAVYAAAAHSSSQTAQGGPRAAPTTTEDRAAQPSEKEVNFIISNRLGERVDLYWDDGQYGKLQDGIDHGADAQIRTFIGHKFFFTQQGNRIVLDRMTISTKDRYTIDAKSIDAFKAKSKLARRKKGSVEVDEFPDCDDRYPRCVGDAERGECTRNPGWMIVNCPRSCDACALRNPKKRCTREFLNMSNAPAMGEGDLAIFFAALEEKFPEMGITVHSRDPWVVTMDNFFTATEADALVAATVGTQEFIRSTDTGTYDEKTGEAKKITSKSRTSLNAWCRDACERDTNVASLTNRIARFTGIPDERFEFFQVLKYAPGQYYKTHHDFDPRTVRLPSGPRILTVFLYLSDVEEGGGTNFPDLGITVMPKKGKALIWPSVLDSNPNQYDPRTRHQALPVTKGTKLAANAWIHQYNMKIPIKWGCTGSFS